MKTKLLMPLVLAAALATGARAETPAADDDASAADQANVATAATVNAPNQTVYVPRLPSAQELANAATAQAGVTIDRIEQSDAGVTVVYRLNDGRTNTVAYVPLPTGNAAGTVAVPPSTATLTTNRAVVVPSPAPTVVYQTAPRVVYYSDPYYYYSPRYAYYPGYYWYPPVSVSLGFGYRGGHWGGHGGHHHGGHRGHRH